MPNITVRHNDEKMVLTVNDDGNLPLNSLKEKFPNADGLAYKDDMGKIHELTVSLEEIIIKPKVKEYSVHIKNEVSDSTGKSTDTEDDKCNNSDSEEKNRTKSEHDKSTRKSLRTPRSRLKTLRIGWLHKGHTDKKYSKMKKPFAGVKRLKLDESQIYLADDIKRLAIKEFTNIDNPAMEDDYTVQLGFFNGRPIDNFTLRGDDDEACDIWSYCDARQMTLYNLNLFILTSPKSDDDSIYGKRSNASGNSDDLGKCKRLKLDDDVHIFYHYRRTSKYSNEVTYTECEKSILHAYLMEEYCGDVPSIEEFEPLDYGYTISRIEKDDKVLLQIHTEEDSSRSFTFPSATEVKPHAIVHKLQGINNGLFGLGVVPSCTDSCRPIVTWYKDKEIYRKGEFLYWLNDVLVDEEEHVWCCSVVCRENESEVKSDDFEIDYQKVIK